MLIFFFNQCSYAAQNESHMVGCTCAESLHAKGHKLASEIKEQTLGFKQLEMVTPVQITRKIMCILH